jgi:hypothetical protein
VCERPFETLLEAAWMPPPPGTSYEDRPASPERLSAASKGSGAAAGGSGAAASSAAQSKPAAYRLVGMRGFIRSPLHAREGLLVMVALPCCSQQ